MKRESKKVELLTLQSPPCVFFLLSLSLQSPFFPPRSRFSIQSVLFGVPLRHGRGRFHRRSIEGIRQGQRSPRQEVPQTRSQRVHEGGASDSNRIRRDGLRWFLRKADLHSHQ